MEEKIIQQIRENLKESGLTVKQVLAVLDKCKSEVLSEMPIKENLNSRITW